MKEPKVISVFNDDGSHSHYALIDVETGDKLWSEAPEECKAQGHPVTQANGTSTSDEALPIGVVSNRLLAEKIILALDDYGRKTDSVEYGLPIDPDTKDFEAKKPQEMIKIVTNILNG